MSNLFHDDHYTVSELTKKLASKLTDAGLRLTTAESCTGGKLSVALCAEENTADFYDVGLVVFSDEAKSRILGVRPETLARYTAGPRRDFDINLDGLAHFGLLPDFLQDLRNQGLAVEDFAPLFRGANDYVEAWAKCEARSKALKASLRTMRTPTRALPRPAALKIGCA